jgi:uncharacterized membrane protein
MRKMDKPSLWKVATSFEQIVFIIIAVVMLGVLYSILSLIN